MRWAAEEIMTPSIEKPSEEAHAAGRSPVEPNDSAPQDERKNYLLGVFNGMLSRLGLSLFHPYLILSAFVYDRTESSLLVGVVSAVWSAGIMWPQLYMSALIEHRPRKLPFYVGATVLRVFVLAAMVATIFLSGTIESGWIIALFIALLFVLSSAQGAAVMPFLDVVGQIIVPTRRGGFFALRNLLGGTLTFLAGVLLAQPLLDRLPSPQSYGVLVGLGAVLVTIGWAIFAFVKEDHDGDPPRRRSFRAVMAGGVKLLKENHNYRQLLGIRLLFRFNALALAFFVPFGVQRLGAVKLSGLLVGAISICRPFSSLIWGRVSDRYGNRLCLRWAGFFFLLSPLTALLAPRVPDLFEWRLPLIATTFDLPLTLYLLSLCIFGLAFEANIIGTNAFMLEAAPDRRRPSYIAFLNTVSFPLTFLPMLAGAIVGNNPFRLDLLFGAVALAAVFFFFCTLRLEEVRHETLRVMNGASPERRDRFDRRRRHALAKETTAPARR